MANQIRFKRASGSDPGASDLVLGEPAVRTDTGELFFKKDDGSVAKVSGGGIDDGDKGDITVSNSGATFTIDSGVVTAAKLDGGLADTTTNSFLKILIQDSNDSIKTDDSIKINPAQNTLSVDGLNVSSQVIRTNNTEELTLTTGSGNGTTDIKVSPTQITLKGNVDVTSGLDVTGNITVSGTVDGRDVAADGTKLDGIASGATNVTNTNQLTNGAGFITATLTNEQVQDIVGGMVSSNTESGITVTYQDGDGTLDFSGASQTDENFTTTLKNKLDGIATGATNVTNNNQLTNGAGYITATLTNEQVQDIVGGMLTGNTETGITVTYQDGDGTIDFVVGTLNQDTTGNAATATALETARTIGGVSFNGTANINLPGVNTAGNQNTSGTSGGFTAGNASNLNSGTIPDARFPSTLPAVSGANLTNISATVAGGAVYENAQSITSNYTVTNGKNAMSAGPIEIASGVTVTIGSGETYTIV